MVSGRGETVRIKFTVLGEPRGKGRPQFSSVNGRAIARTPKQTALYENLVVTEYRRQVGDAKFPDDAELDMRIMAYYTIPASASKKKQGQMNCWEKRPTKKPDMDNIVKVVSDALNAVAYRDDAQIVDCQIRKFYSHNPRIEVTIIAAK